MAAFTESFTKIRSSVEQRFNWNYFLQDNVTGSPWLMAWILFLTLGTAFYTVRQLNDAPLPTIIILIAVAVGLVLTVANGLFQYHTRVGEWLRINLLSSVSNVLLTLLLLLLLASAFRGAWEYAVVNATFDPALTAPAVRGPADGATWGVLAGARNLLIYGRLGRDNIPRVNQAFYLLLVLSAITFIANKTGLWARNNLLRRILTYIWLASPLMLFILLNGVPYVAGSNLIDFNTLFTGTVVFLAVYGLLFWQRVIKFSVVGLGATAVAWPLAYLLWRVIGRSALFPPVNPDSWGGLLLTLIVATSVIILSFPIGILLALGRRSQVRGIPNWIVWPIAIFFTLLYSFTTTPEFVGEPNFIQEFLLNVSAASTPQLLEAARNGVETVLSFWPLLIIGAAYGLQRSFKGNVVAAASTTFIEVVRGVPLITLLFMGIIMAPFFFVRGTTISNTYAVIAGYTLFASAYMAELIRGGLQAIPKGQFEAADSLGLNTLQKMRFIVLPQALRILIPALVGSFIGAFKSSSLVSVVGLFDLVGIATAVIGNPQWLGLKKELYYAMAVFYFLVSFAMSSYSRRLEVKLGAGQR